MFDRVRIRVARWIAPELPNEVAIQKMTDHGTDEWEVSDRAEFTDTPEEPCYRLSLKRRSSETSTTGTSTDLPYPYTAQDLEVAKARLRLLLPVSWHYFSDDARAGVALEDREGR